MSRCIKYLLKTAISALLLTILMTIGWDATFPGKIYYCTDGMGLDYLHPGSWVHGEPESVDDVPSATSRSMSEPDVMLRGWTTGKLWMTWSIMMGSSMILALLHAKFQWFRRMSAPEFGSANKSRLDNRP